jgi:hypothetical protein
MTVLKRKMADQMGTSVGTSTWAEKVWDIRVLPYQTYQIAIK